MDRRQGNIFVGRDKVVMTAQYADGTHLVFRDLNPDVLFRGPIVVVTSKATASAAEIVAQALKDYGRAVIVGDPYTYGKGSIQLQTVTDKNEKGAWKNVPLCLTVGRFYAVSGYSPQSIGVMSDIVVPGIYERAKSRDDPDNMAARIQPSFQDSLDDVQPNAKEWYSKHYVPFMQKPTDQYRKWIPTLQKRSVHRLEHSPLGHCCPITTFSGRKSFFEKSSSRSANKRSGCHRGRFYPAIGKERSVRRIIH